MTETPTPASHVESDLPIVSFYRRIIVPLVRAATVLVVVFFLLGGIATGANFMDTLYTEEPQLDSNGDYSCQPEEEAQPGDTICRYATPVALTIGGVSGGAIGLAAGLIATFSVEVGVTVYLAARKYLRS